MARRRRRELFPPDRRLQARMVVAAVLTPLIALGGVAALVVFAPRRFLAGVVVAAVVGGVLAERRRRRADSARALRADEAPELHATVERLCVLADLPRPELVLVDERQPNSWIVDAPGRPPRLHVTEGLLDLLSGPELDAVVAHELAHVANRDATVMTVVGGPGAVLLEGSRAVTGRAGGFWPMQLGAVLAGLIGMASRVGTNALSRYRELAADAGAAALTGRPAALAGALAKVSGQLARLPQDDLRVAAGRDAFHLLPVRGQSGTARGLRARLGATHPSLEQRLSALERLERRMHTARPSLPPR